MDHVQRRTIRSIFPTLFQRPRVTVGATILARPFSVSSSEGDSSRTFTVHPDPLATLPNMKIAKAINEASKAAMSVDEPSMKQLLAEASTHRRIVSYSGLDLCELMHSVSTMISAVALDEEESRGNALVSLLNSLLDQIVARKHCLFVRNVVPRGSGRQQTITIIGVSNVLHAVTQVVPVRGILSDGAIKKLHECMVEVLCNSCEKDAVLACRPFHLLSIMHSLNQIGALVSDDGWKIVKRFLKELHRKSPFLTEDELTRLGEIHSQLSKSFKGRPDRLQFIQKFMNS
jgi:hypothetical protein